MSSTQLLNDPNYFLQTKRLGFRLWAEDDFHLALNLWSNTIVTELIGGPFTVEKIQERFSNEIKNMKVYNVQYWPVFLLKTGEHIGCCGFRPYKKKRIYLKLAFIFYQNFGDKGLLEKLQMLLYHIYSIIQT